jgi:hypothetical protein
MMAAQRETVALCHFVLQPLVAGAEIFLQQRAFSPRLTLTHTHACCYAMSFLSPFCSFLSVPLSRIIFLTTYRTALQPGGASPICTYARHAECLCACVRACVRACVCVCVCVCVCMCVFSYTHMHIYITRYVHVRNWKNNPMPCFTNTRPKIPSYY